MARLSLVLTVSALAAVAGLRLRASSLEGMHAGDGAVEATLVEATKAFARKTWAAAGAWIVGGAGLVLAAYGVLAPRPVADEASSRGSLAIAELVAFVLGAGAALAASSIALRLGARVEGSTGGDRVGALETSLRTSAAPALVSAALSTLAFGVALVVASSVASGVDRGSFLAFAVGAHAFGACIGGAMAHVGGRVFSQGASSGARARAEEDPDPRNPAVVLERVANRLADRSGHGAEIFELAALDLVAATILASSAGLDARGGELAPLFFPVVARAFGLVAAFVGVMAVKAPPATRSSPPAERSPNDDESPLDAADRGSTVAAGLSAIGAVASAWWLLRGAFVGAACAAVLGVVCAWSLVRFGRTSRGAIASSAPTIVALFLVPASWALGHVAGHRHGALGLASASVGFVCASAFPLAASTLASRYAIGDARAEASAAMRVGLSRWVQAASVVVAWVGARSEARGGGVPSPHASDLAVLAPVAGVACAIGAAIAVGSAVLARRAAARVTQATEEEIARVLADVPTEDGRSVFPIDFHPAHDHAVGHVAADAHLHAATSILLAVGAPIVVGLVARRGFGLGVEAVVALVFGATLVPLLFAPLSRALSSQEPAPADDAPWTAFAARVVIAVALALAVIFS
jgi:hypothetical protein